MKYNITNAEELREFVKVYCNFENITEQDGKIIVGGGLVLEGTPITSLPDNLTVGGGLVLEGTSITSLPDNLTVGGSLYLEGTPITSLPDNLTVGSSLDLRGTSITSLPDNLTVGGYLDLRRTPITSLPDNLTVGGSLVLEGTSIISLPDNLTVGGSLYLRGTSITSLPDNLTVGSSLDLRGTSITNTSLEKMKVKSLNEGYCEKGKYIYFDGILWGNVKSVKRLENKTIYKTPLGYCVVEENLSAHGKILKEAMEDLMFKKIKNTDVSEIAKEIKKSGKVNRMQYRAITGACQFGTEQFCIKNNIQDLEEIDLEKLRKILINDYGAEKFWQLIDKED